MVEESSATGDRPAGAVPIDLAEAPAAEAEAPAGRSRSTRARRGCACRACAPMGSAGWQRQRLQARAPPCSRGSCRWRRPRRNAAAARASHLPPLELTEYGLDTRALKRIEIEPAQRMIVASLHFAQRVIEVEAVDKEDAAVDDCLQKRKNPGVATPGGPRDIPVGENVESVSRVVCLVKNSLQTSTFCRGRRARGRSRTGFIARSWRAAPAARSRCRRGTPRRRRRPRRSAAATHAPDGGATRDRPAPARVSPRGGAAAPPPLCCLRDHASDLLARCPEREQGPDQQVDGH